MSGRSVARSRIVGRGRGRGGNKLGRGGGNRSGNSNGDGGNGSGGNYANLRDDDINDFPFLEHQERFESAHVDSAHVDSAHVSDDVEISNIAPMSNALESNASNSTPKKLVNFTPDLECFDDDGSASSAVTEIIKNMYRGVWPTWTSIPTIHKGQMFDQFKKDFRWDSECDGLMRKVFYKVCGKRLREMLRTARDKASSKAAAEQDGIGNPDISSYNPEWINQDLWLSLINHWNKPEWKNLSVVNTANSEKRTGGSHTTGSGGFIGARRKLETILGRPPKAHETFIYNHVKKGTNPFVSEASGSSSQPEFVDEKSRLFVEKVKGLLSEKHGPNEDDYPDFDPEIWDECTGGKKKGKFYGSSTSKDPCYVLTGTPSSLSTGSSYATHQPQVQILTQNVEEMQERHQMQQREIEEMKKREEKQKKELEDLKAKSEAETKEMKATIAAMMKFLPDMMPPT